MSINKNKHQQRVYYYFIVLKYKKISMSHNQEKQRQESKSIINKCQIQQEGVELLSSFISQSQPNQLNKVLKQYSQNVVNFGECSAEKYLQQTLLSSINSLKKFNNDSGFTSSVQPKTERSFNESFIQQKETPNDTFTTIFIKKVREQQNDRIISYQLRKAIIKFYTQQIRKRFYKAKLRDQQYILKLFGYAQFSQQTSQLNIDQYFLGELSKYQQKLDELNNLLSTIYRQFDIKQSRCLPIMQIRQQNLNNLKYIHIQYALIAGQIYDYCRYSISAFELFKVIHQNQRLEEVKIIGVAVYQFKQFIKQLNCITNEKGKEYKQGKGRIWMKQINPSKSLKLSLNTQIEFGLNQLEEQNSKIYDLQFFLNLFHWVSDLQVTVYLMKYLINELQDFLYGLWRCLQPIKKIKINIQAGQWDQIDEYQAQIVRAALFGGLAQFITIDKLVFQEIKFNYQIKVNDFLALELTLKTIFHNNKISHLKLYRCTNFPIFPKIQTLQSLYIRGVSFRSKCNFMKMIIKNNRQLKSIKYWPIMIIQREQSEQSEQSLWEQWGQQELQERQGVQEVQASQEEQEQQEEQEEQIAQQVQQEQFDWKIDDKLFNQLQTLTLLQEFINIGLLSPKSPSSLKNLSLNIVLAQNQVIQLCFYDIFPKLINLTFLKIIGLDFKFEFLSAIPFPHLEELHILENGLISNEELQAIDKKWPYLKEIELKDCRNIDFRVWNSCLFKGLMWLRIESRMLGEQRKALMYLKNKGITVYQE